MPDNHKTPDTKKPPPVTHPMNSSTTAGASATTPKPAATAATPTVIQNGTRSNPQFDVLDLLLFLQPIYNTPKFEHAINECKVDSPECGLRAREALFELAGAILAPSAAKSHADLEVVKKAVSDVAAKVNLLHDRATADDLDTFHDPRASVSVRYLTDHPEEKKALTKYVAQTFFPDEKIYAFIQASATAIHLAREIAERTIRPGSLFYTNSVVVPLVLLQRVSGVSVYTVCGNMHDEMCGGWLPRMDDDEARAHLAQLFHRVTDKLRDSFLTPIAVASDTGEVLFTRAELVELLKGVIAPSRQLVIMTLSSRVHPNRDAVQKAFIHNALAGISPLARDKKAKPPQLVVSHDPNDGKSDAQRQQVISQLTAHGFDVHWQGVQGRWQLHSAKVTG